MKETEEADGLKGQHPSPVMLLRYRVLGVNDWRMFGLDVKLPCSQGEIDMSTSEIKVVFAHGVDVVIPWEEKIFPDWYDFADWLKQENLNGGPVVIIAWEYVPRPTKEG